ncbi:MAG: hypothetical protein IJJ21_05765, partial [Firmicutes bacterium]|nr:hypothetical protein [Bacillota bacterium]
RSGCILVAHGSRRKRLKAAAFLPAPSLTPSGHLIRFCGIRSGTAPPVACIENNAEKDDSRLRSFKSTRIAKRR